MIRTYKTKYSKYMVYVDFNILLFLDHYSELLQVINKYKTIEKIINI